MTHPPTSTETRDETGVGPERGSNSGTPRWVKVFGITALVVIVLVVVVALTGLGGDHGPGRHASVGGDAPDPHPRPTSPRTAS